MKYDNVRKEVDTDNNHLGRKSFIFLGKKLSLPFGLCHFCFTIVALNLLILLSKNIP